MRSGVRETEEQTKEDGGGRQGHGRTREEHEEGERRRTEEEEEVEEGDEQDDEKHEDEEEKRGVPPHTSGTTGDSDDMRDHGGMPREPTGHRWGNQDEATKETRRAPNGKPVYHFVGGAYMP
jgi:hypothetical protein